MAGNKIQIKFEPKGSKALIKAINELTKAQRKLETGQKRLAQGQHLVNQRVSSNTKALGNQAGMMKKVQGQIALMRNFLLLYAFAYQLVAKSMGALLKKYSEQEKAEKKLSQAFGGNIHGLKTYAAALQRQTVYGDEAILSAQSLLGAYIKDEESLKSATDATLDLAAAKGLDLNTAALLVAKTIGSTTDALTRYVPLVRVS